MKSGTYYAEHRDIIRAKARERYKKLKKRIIATVRAWRAKNADKCRQHSIAYYYRHRDRILAERAASYRKRKGSRPAS